MTQQKDVFTTPGRECSHAKKGCCPLCFDPAGLLRSTREFRLKRFRSQNSSLNEPQTTQESQSNG